MSRLYSNGGNYDFVANAYTRLVSAGSEVWVAAPFVSRTDDLIKAAKAGKRVNLLVGLNSATSPAALEQAVREPNIRVRYYTHRRFHAKIYLSDSTGMLGSANLTESGLTTNREVMIVIDGADDQDTLNDLRAIFNQLWDPAPVLTLDIVTRFREAWERWEQPKVDDLIGQYVGEAQPPNVNVASVKATADRLFGENLRRRLTEYRAAFDEVQRVLENAGLHRPELAQLAGQFQTNRFLSWARQKHAPGDTWRSTPPRSEVQRRAEILRLGREWCSPSEPDIHGDYAFGVERVQQIFGRLGELAGAERDALTEGLLLLHAFGEQSRFVTGGLLELPRAFWNQNNDDVGKVSSSLQYLLYGAGPFEGRLYDLLYDSRYKLGLFGESCALELYGTLTPNECPPLNGRIVKGLRFLGFHVAGT